MLDIQTGIFWASNIEIRRFKNSNSSTRTGLQLSWMIQSEINFVLKNRIAKTRAGTFLATGFSTFSLDIHMVISWASDIKIRKFKNPNSSTHTGLQLLWRIQSEINSFWRTEFDRNLVGQKNFLIWFRKLTMPNIPIWLRVCHKNNEP